MRLLLTLLLITIISCKQETVIVNFTKEEAMLLDNLCVDKEQLLDDLSNKEKQKSRSFPMKIEDFTEKEATIFDRKGSSPNYAGNYYIIIDKKFYRSCQLPTEFWKANLKIVISATSYTNYCNDCDVESKPIIISKIQAM